MSVGSALEKVRSTFSGGEASASRPTPAQIAAIKEALSAGYSLEDVKQNVPPQQRDAIAASPDLVGAQVGHSTVDFGPAKKTALAEWERNGYDPAKVGPELDKLITVQLQPLHGRVTEVIGQLSNPNDMLGSLCPPEVVAGLLQARRDLESGTALGPDGMTAVSERLASLEKHVENLQRIANLQAGFRPQVQNAIKEVRSRIGGTRASLDTAFKAFTSQVDKYAKEAQGYKTRAQNWAKVAVRAAVGAVSGLAVGAAIGFAVGGPVGMAIGAGVGAVAGAIVGGTVGSKVVNVAKKVFSGW
jgi:ElaB/YqjD/DUF883 family membrane-anchored ribosome-binding protein